MQSENNVYWWRVPACVKLQKAVRQVTVVVISNRAWWQNSQQPEDNCFLTTAPVHTHTHTHTHTRKHSHLCSVVSSPFCQHLHRFRHTQTHKEYSQFVSLSSPARTPLPISLIHDPAASELVLSNSSSSPPSLSLCRSLTWSDFSCILAILTGGCGGIPSWQFYSTHYKWLNGIHAGPAG